MSLSQIVLLIAAVSVIAVLAFSFFGQLLCEKELQGSYSWIDGHGKKRYVISNNPDIVQWAQKIVANDTIFIRAVQANNNITFVGGELKEACKS